MKDLMKELNLKELEDCNGGKGMSKAQCMWIKMSCDDPRGCGQAGACALYEEYCK